jgi:hypothetical protein
MSAAPTVTREAVEKVAAEIEPTVFGGPSEEQQQAHVEEATRDGRLTFSLLRADLTD